VGTQLFRHWLAVSVNTIAEQGQSTDNAAGVWNMIGSWGFLLCGAFGFSRNSGMMYQSALATFWGAWAFLIGSCCQLVEVTFRKAPD